MPTARLEARHRALCGAHRSRYVVLGQASARSSSQKLTRKKRLCFQSVVLALEAVALSRAFEERIVIVRDRTVPISAHRAPPS